MSSTIHAPRWQPEAQSLVSPPYPFILFSPWINDRLPQGGCPPLVRSFPESKSRPTKDHSRILERTLTRSTCSTNCHRAPTRCRRCSRQGDTARHQRTTQVSWLFHSDQHLLPSGLPLAPNSSQLLYPQKSAFLIPWPPLDFYSIIIFSARPSPTTLFKSPSKTALPSFFPFIITLTII